MEPENPASTEHRPQFDRFSIFLIAKNAQNSYGVKTGDYLRYRRYCTRKIDKIRKVMQFKYGNRTKFVKKDVTVERADDKRIMQIALLSCEKYWASANESKFNETMKQVNKNRAKFTTIKKLKRAYDWSQKLFKVCKAQTDSITASEAQAYSFYLQGLYNLERQQWKQAQTKLIACREIISDLLGNIDTMNARVYKEKIDQIDQTIKFCNFKISKGKELSIEEIIEMRKNGEESLSTLIGSFAERKLKQLSLDSGNEIRFGEERYPIKDQKIIQQKSKIDMELQNLQIIKKKALNQSSDEQLFDQLLNFFSSVITIIDETIKAVDGHKQNVKQYTQAEIAVYKKVSLLFEQIKLNILIDRNNIIFQHSLTSTDDKASKKSAPQTLAKLLSNTISIYGQYIELVKNKNEGSDGVDQERIRAIDAKVFFYRALRLFYVGQVYFNNEKIKQAYSLWQEFERCMTTVRNSQQESIKAELTLVNLQDIMASLRAYRVKCMIKNYRLNETQKDSMTNQMQQLTIKQRQALQTEFSLYQLMTEPSLQSSKLTLEQYSELTPIELPGRIEPIPTRPIFYDIFQSEIAYPSLDNKVEKSWFGKLFRK